MRPLVSIIIPVYNSASFLPECLDSIINQSYKNLEIICINDGSTDNSLSIIKKYARSDKRIKYYTQQNKGQSSARNLGLKMCKGEYISFVDSDDMIELNTISQAIHLFIHEKVDIVMYNMEMFLPDGTRFICFTGSLFPHSNMRTNSRAQEFIVNFTNAAPAVFKKSTIKSYFVEGMIYEDWVFMVQYLLQPLNVFWINSPLYKYRRNFEQSTTSNITDKCLDLYKAYYMARESIQSSVMKNTYAYINDIKILNEASGFIQANLLKVEFSDLTKTYIEELIKIVSNFSDSYYNFLISFISRERKDLLNIIRSDISIGVKDINYNKTFESIKNSFYGILHSKELKHKIKIYLLNKMYVIKTYSKKFMRIIFPAYRVASSTREILEVLTLETKSDFVILKERIERIESKYADINKKIKILEKEQSAKVEKQSDNINAIFNISECDYGTLDFDLVKDKKGGVNKK